MLNDKRYVDQNLTAMIFDITICHLMWYDNISNFYNIKMKLAKAL